MNNGRSSSSATTMAVAAACLSLACVVSAAGAYAVTSSGGGLGRLSGSPASSGGDPDVSPIPVTPPAAGGGGAPPSGGTSVLRAGPYQGAAHYFLWGGDASSKPQVSMQMSPVSVESGRCPGNQVVIRSTRTQRYLVPDANGQVQWVPTADVPFACWVPVDQPACPGDSKVYEPVRFPGTHLKRARPAANGANVAVSLATPAEYNVATNPDFASQCWKRDTMGPSTR